MAELIRRFERWLESRGLRLTRERLAVVDALQELRGSFEFESVAMAVRASRVSRATVFRTLGFLQEAGLIVRSASQEDDAGGSYRLVRATLNPQLCRATHSKLISGRCPWCGRQIRNGEPEAD